MAILSIKTQPLSQTVTLGGTLSLSVDATGGSGVYAFQWKKDSSNIQDATSKTYSKSSFAESNAGLYFASAYDGTTTVLSNDATVGYPLTIDTQPLSQIVALGGTLNLSVASLRWRQPLYLSMEKRNRRHFWCNFQCLYKKWFC